MLRQSCSFAAPLPPRWRPACFHRPGAGAIVRPRAAAGSEATEEEVALAFSAREHIILRPSFPAPDSSLVADLRAHFQRRFADPLRSTSDRFCWDYWYVPEQYQLMRTPADAFFPPELYDRLEEALTEWGERELGCRGISPLWLSYYVDGCRQELHTDSPHGPWAFVLSLTDWEARRFTGGETTILRPSTLDHWRGFDAAAGAETPQLLALVAPLLGQLAVFDPRLPHGVRMVEGCRDPRAARVVVHGWFAPPTPFFEGALEEDAATPALNAALGPLYQELAELPAVVGTLVARIGVQGDGRVAALSFLPHNLVVRPEAGLGGPEDDAGVAREVMECVARGLAGLRFPEAPGGGGTSITLPFIFE